MQTLNKAAGRQQTACCKEPVQELCVLSYALLDKKAVNAS